MTTPDVSVFGALEQSRQRREQQSENSAREATSTIRYVTTGVGSITPGQPVKFDVKFVEEPRVLSGCVLQKAPDTRHYRLPQVTCGVLRWVREVPAKPGNQAFSDVALATGAATGPVGKVDPSALYVGAYLYFVVVADPLRPPRSNGSNRASLIAARSASTDPVKIANLTALIAEATEALYLTAFPAKVTLTHHLTFTAAGIKGLNMENDSLLQGALEPRPTKLG